MVGIMIDSSIFRGDLFVLGSVCSFCLNWSLEEIWKRLGKNTVTFSRWWQLKYFFEFSPLTLRKMNPF